MSVYFFKDGIKISPDKAEDAEYFTTQQVSVFESLRTYGGAPFKLKDHLARMGESAKTVGLELPTELEHVEKELVRCLQKIPKGDYFIRVTATSDTLLILFVPEKKYPKSIYMRGVKVSTVPTLRNAPNSAFPPAKSSNFLNQILGTIDGAASGSFEVIFKGQDGLLQEARIFNFFIVKGGMLKTPPRGGLLGGVTRKFVIELAAHLAVPVKETPLTRHEIYNADEAFLTNTSGEIVPIREWDGRRIGARVPGPVTKKLREIYRKKAHEECQKTRPH